MYPELDLEFSICDDGSFLPVEGEDPRQTITKLPLKCEPKNPCVPINIAVRQASSEIIVLTNPEIEHRDPVLYDMLAALEGPDDYVMTGCRDTRGGEWFAGPEREMENVPRGTYFHFCVMFHRALFERAGGFDEAYREGHGYDDNDWLWRLQNVGARFKYVPGVTWHCKDPRVSSFWKGPLLARNRALLEQKWGHLMRTTE